MEMTFNGILEEVKRQNPDLGTNYREFLAVLKADSANAALKYNEIQKLAGEKYTAWKTKCKGIAKDLLDKYNAGQGSLAQSKKDGVAGAVPAPAGTIDIGELYVAQDRIIKGNIDVNSIVSIGRSVMPDGQLVKHGPGQNAINTKVTFEDGAGNRLPVETDRYFEIFLLS